MNIDMHTHTFYSHDGLHSPEDMIDAAIARGLQGLAITDHDSLDAHARALTHAKRRNFIVIPGCEISSAGGHIIALWQQEPIPKGLSIEETIDKIMEQDALVSIPHPFSPYRKVAIGRKVDYRKVNAVEVFNGRQPRYYDRMCFRLAMEFGSPVTAGSDAHSIRELGYAYTYFGATTEEDLRKQILTGIPHKTRRIPASVLLQTYSQRFARFIASRGQARVTQPAGRDRHTNSDGSISAPPIAR